MRGLSYNSKRAIVGLAMIPVLLCSVNSYAHLNWFGKYAEATLIASVALLFIVMTFIGPSIDEMQERKAKRKTEKIERKLSYNSILVFIGLAGVLVLLCAVNYFADLNWFGIYGSDVLVVSVALFFVCRAYMGPSTREEEGGVCRMEERNQNREENEGNTET